VKKRMIIMLATVLVVVGGLGFVKYKQIQTAIAQASSFAPPPEAVTTIRVGEERWPATLGAIGTTEAVQGVTVSADQPGVVDVVSFDSGRRVAEGEVLVRLDTRQEQAQLAAAQAQLELSRLNNDRMAGLRKEGIVAQADDDRSSAELKQAEARVGEIKATIERKTIRAPFGGLLGIRQVNRGQYLNAGSPVVELQSLDPIYVNFSVPQNAIAEVKPGVKVHLALEGVANAEFVGQVTAVNSVVDPNTRNIQVQATVANPLGTLRPGMFVQTQVVLPAQQAHVSVPASAINYAPYGDSVFVVGDVAGPNGQKYVGVRQQFVKVGASRGDQVAVLSGLKPGESVATSGVFKLRNGSAVKVNNVVQPGNDPAPKPEDN
jgi:membrane fusion protein (multidrug efflux system)